MKLREILLADDVVQSINDNLDYLLEQIPQIKPMIGFDQKNPHHHLDVWGHTLLALSMSKKDFDIRLCLLLHDIGKPFSCQDGEIRHFKGHEIVSAKMANEILHKLGFENGYIKEMCHLIEIHDTPITADQVENDYETCLKLFDIQSCDALAHHPDKLEKRRQYLKETQALISKKGAI